MSKPLLGDDEVRRVSGALRDGWISSAGPAIVEFEEKWAERCNRAFGVAVANGTVALQLAVRSLGLGRGDEIIMPSFTIISCALAAIYNGCRPVLVDCDETTWCLDVDLIERHIGPRTKAIMPVHIYGHPVDMGPLLEIAERHELSVIEDAAEAHGAEYRDPDTGWHRCGSMGTLSTFSFYSNKLVTTGEGGMIVTDDEDLATSARSLRNLAFGEGSRRFEHTALGFNFRMTNMQAELGLAQLRQFQHVIELKRAIAANYRSLLSDIPYLTLPPEEEWARSVYWMYGVLLDESRTTMTPERLAELLLEEDIQTRPFFLGLHEQPVLREIVTCEGSFPQTEKLSRTGLYLPSGPDLVLREQENVSVAIHRILEEPGK